MMASLCPFLLTFLLFKNVESCGISTHTEVIERALVNYDNPIFGPGEVVRILNEHRGAFQAGAPYPDAFYNSLCAGGNHHSQSEDIHWGAYQKVAWDYFKKTYPEPIGNKDAERLMAFILGITSHQVTDVSWHSLSGLKNGMIEMLSSTSFDGNFGSAHDYADFGGDILGMLEWNTSYIDQWYVPVRDLHNIFIEYYGDDQGISQNLISSCTLMLLAGRIAEQELGAILYPAEAIRAPIFLDEIQDYFSGGLNDMAAWTQIVWDTGLIMASEGTDNCHIEKNPMGIFCNGYKKITKEFGDYPEEKVKEGKKAFFESLKNKFGIHDLLEFAHQVITVTDGPNGVHFKIDNDQFKKAPLSPKPKSQATKNYWAVVSSKAFANMGQSLLVADIDGDGLEDLLIGAPGYQVAGSRNQGCVYLLNNFGSFTLGAELDVKEELEKICSPGFREFERFGHSIASWDDNNDGHLDLMVGSPTAGREKAQYDGCVSTFHGASNGRFSFVTQECIHKEDQDGNFGISLFSKKDNEILASGIFASQDGSRQVGSIRSHNSEIKDALFGTEEYSWLGNSITRLDGSRLAVSVHMKAKGGVNTVGEVKIVDAESFAEIATIEHPDGYSDQFGYSLLSSNLTIEGSIRPCLIVGAPVATYGIHTNAGAIYIFDANTYEYLGKMHADRALGRFGRSLAQSKTKIFIGAPRYHQKSNALQEEGAVFVLSKATNLPIGDITKMCPDNVPSPCIESWIETLLVPPEDQKRSLYGHQVKSISRGPNEFIAVSAPRSRSSVQQSGAVYIYQVNNQQNDL